MQAAVISDKDNNQKTTSPVERITFTVYGEIPTAKVDYAESHYLGEPIASKWNTFLKNYTQVSEQSIGFSSTHVRLNKPVIYNAVRKGEQIREEVFEERTHEQRICPV